MKKPAKIRVHELYATHEHCATKGERQWRVLCD